MPDPAPALDNYANNFSTPAQTGFDQAAADRRKKRFNMRAFLWRASRLKGVRKCGKVSRRPHGEVGVRWDGTSNGVGLHGLCTCGSPWSDPVCNAKIMLTRALEVGSVVASAQALGYQVGLFTLTARHHKGQRLARLWGALSKSWKAVIGGRPWETDKARFGIVGWVRVAECTHGDANGWHPHLHVLVIGRDLDRPGVLDELLVSMWGRWRSSLVAAGLDAPLIQASDARLVTADGLSGTKLGRYLTESKSAGLDDDVAHKIGMELSQTQSKQARYRHSTVTPWVILEAAMNGETWALELWWEWEAASKGKRQISYSKGLRELLGLLGPELTDDEIAQAELGTEDDEHVVITDRGWRRMVANPDWIPDMQTQLARFGWDSLSLWLWERAVEHERV